MARAHVRELVGNVFAAGPQSPYTPEAFEHPRRHRRIFPADEDISVKTRPESRVRIAGVRQRGPLEHERRHTGVCERVEHALHFLPAKRLDHGFFARDAR